MRFNPIYSALLYAFYTLEGRIRLGPSQMDIEVFGDKTFTAYRHISIRKNIKESTAVFWVRFTLPGRIGFERNRRISARSIPFFCGLPGFRKKYWCVHKGSNEYLGLYEWSPPERALEYSDSYALRFMTQRAAVGSVNHGIFPNMTLDRLLSQEESIVLNPWMRKV